MYPDAAQPYRSCLTPKARAWTGDSQHRMTIHQAIDNPSKGYITSAQAAEGLRSAAAVPTAIEEGSQPRYGNDGPVP